MKKFLFIFLLVFVIALSLFSCKPTTYTVAFDADGGSAVEAQIVEEGKNAQKPENPTKEGYNFLGWYAGDEEWSFAGYPVNDNIILKAKWEKKAYTVTFDANGGNGSTEKTVEHGKAVAAPMASRPNYSLVGWYNGDTKWSFDNKITSDITLTAKWEGFPKKITFDANGGTVSEEERKVPYGSEIGILPLPEKDNFKFLGWFDSNDVDMENRIKKTTIVEGNMTLVAKWELDETQMVVEFNVNGGTLDKNEPTTIYVKKNTAIGKLPLPTMAGHSFDGWYTQNDEQITSETIITTSISLTAKYLDTSPVTCLDGTYAHNWTPWNYEYIPATCTQDGKAARVCTECGHTEYKTGKAKLGHNFTDDWTYGLMNQTGKCSICKRDVTIDYENLSNKIKETVIFGNVFGASNVDCLYNGNWDETTGTFCGTGGSVTVAIEFIAPTYIDCVFIKGYGSYSYKLSVLFEGDSDYTNLGDGEFGDKAQKFEISGTITSVRIHMETSSFGTLTNAFWQEVAFAKIPEID